MYVRACLCVRKRACECVSVRASVHGCMSARLGARVRAWVHKRVFQPPS